MRGRRWGGPGDGVSVRHFVEHLEGATCATRGGIEADEGVSHVDVAREAELEDERMRGEADGEGGRGGGGEGAGLEEEGKRVEIGGKRRMARRGEETTVVWARIMVFQAKCSSADQQESSRDDPMSSLGRCLEKCGAAVAACMPLCMMRGIEAPLCMVECIQMNLSCMISCAHVAAASLPSSPTNFP
ncbi:hypothetical protein J5N97_021482 [Dioscorea zingiberensis]|uniref:Uncharacterized protein n=1 Tax=Dioscorea zingiberensis TaxID=325984 RepID=A0A9D5CJ82_9LILI|nr:hypothetical protein J5N97_021482 [Dioscorea zingiberensis]